MQSRFIVATLCFDSVKAEAGSINHNHFKVEQQEQVLAPTYCSLFVPTGNQCNSAQEGIEVLQFGNNYLLIAFHAIT